MENAGGKKRLLASFGQMLGNPGGTADLCVLAAAFVSAPGNSQA